MPQFECIIVHNHASVALWLTQQLRFTLIVPYEAAWHSQILVIRSKVSNEVWSGNYIHL
jgi:hypothetical protein